MISSFRGNGVSSLPRRLHMRVSPSSTMAVIAFRRHGSKPTTHCCLSSSVPMPSETFQARGESNADPIAQCKVDGSVFDCVDHRYVDARQKMPGAGGETIGEPHFCVCRKLRPY